MTHKIRIKRGLDIPLDGAPWASDEVIAPASVGMVPDDFGGHTWKCAVKEGDAVNVGSPLLFDKATGNIKIVSPLAGIVKEIRRGERRKILAVVVEPAEVEAEKPEFNLELSAGQIRATLQQSGLWAMMRQRPFDIVPESDSTPRDIFITAFDSSPLAPSLFTKEEIPFIEKGLEVLEAIAGKKPFIATSASHPCEFKGAENIIVDGPHPAGNVGVQIAAVKPVNKGEVVWTLDVVTVARIGRLYTDGILSWETRVALTGPEMPSPRVVSSIVGADIKSLLPPALIEKKNLRFISGNVLTGYRISPEKDFLRFPYRQITVIEEGNEADEFMGWASMKPNKYSVKRTFPAFLRGLSKPFPFDARIKGGRRAMILSGELDKVFPFDIYPEYLIRAIQAGDIDRMEKLGIYEVAPEDFALPEFVDTSKQELQKIVRDGLDNLRSEL